MISSITKTVLITGADRGLGLALCAGLLTQGWDVFAGQYLPAWPELDTLKRDLQKIFMSSRSTSAPGNLCRPRPKR